MDIKVIRPNLYFSKKKKENVVVQYHIHTRYQKHASVVYCFRTFHYFRLYSIVCVCVCVYFTLAVMHGLVGFDYVKDAILFNLWLIHSCFK